MWSVSKRMRARRYKRAHGIFNGLFWDILVRELRNPLKNWATRNCRFQPWVIEFTWRQRVSFRGTVVVRDKLRPSIRIQGAMPNQMRQNFFQYRKKKLTIAVSWGIVWISSFIFALFFYPRTPNAQASLQLLQWKNRRRQISKSSVLDGTAPPSDIIVGLLVLFKDPWNHSTNWFVVVH